MATSGIIVVTGITSFVGSAVAHAALSRGYKVRGTVRSQEKADFIASLPAFKSAVEKGQLTFAILEDVITGDFTDSFKGDVTGLIHTASPFHFAGKDMAKDYLDPAIQGTRNAIQAAKKADGVKGIVVTSSFAAILDMNDKTMPYNNKVFTEADWNPCTYDEAVQSGNPGIAYCASKSLAEKEAHKLGKEFNIPVATMCPPLVHGPSYVFPKDPKNLNESNRQTWDILSSDKDEVPPQAFPLWVDVRDLAEAHVVALEKGAVGRFLTAGGRGDNQMIVDLAHKIEPENAKSAPVGKPGDYMTNNKALHNFSASKAEKELGIKFRGHEACYTDMIHQFYTKVPAH